MTFGIGHLVSKRKSYLIAGAQSDATLSTKLGTQKLGGKNITYLPVTLNGTADLTNITKKATELARTAIAKAVHKKDYAQLTVAEKKKIEERADAAVKKETDLLGKTPKGVFGVDLQPFEEVVNAKVTGVKLTQSEFDALVSFTFNVGSGNFGGSKLFKRINRAKFRSGDAKQRKTAIRKIELEGL